MKAGPLVVKFSTSPGWKAEVEAGATVDVLGIEVCVNDYRIGT